MALIYYGSVALTFTVRQMVRLKLKGILVQHVVGFFSVV